MPTSRNRLRVLVLSQYYPPEAHGAIPSSVARGLAARGHDVQVVTTFPNHPHGRVFAGWEQRLCHRERDGLVHVRRVPMLPDHSRSAVRRMVSSVSFAVASLSAWRSARRADVVYVYCAQPTVAFAPMVWRRLCGVPFVLHVQDIWPESVLGSGLVRDGRVAGAVRVGILALLRTVHRSAARVVAIAPGAAELLVSRGAVPSRTSTILNWTTQAPAERVPRSADGTTRIVYAGNLGPSQGLDAVVRAAARCSDLHGLRFEFVGDGLAAEHLRRLAAELGARNVDFHAPVTKDRMPEVHARADFEVVALSDAPMSAITIPSKLQDALSHGVPVIAALPGDAAHLVRAGDAGHVVPSGDVTALEAAFRRAHASTAAERDALSRNARAVATDHMSASAAVDRVEQILQEARK